MVKTSRELVDLNNMKDNIDFALEEVKYNDCLDSSNKSYCDNQKLTRIKDIIRNEMKETDKEIMNTLKKLKTNAIHLESSNKYENELDKFYKEKEDYYKLLEGNLEELEKKSAISNRMTNFYSEKTENILDISFYLKILYWILFVVIIVIMIAKKQWSEVKYWPMVIVLVLFPLIFMKSIIFQMPIANKQVKISSVFDYLYENFEHFNVDNIYLISFIVISILITMYTMISLLPFKESK